MTSEPLLHHLDDLSAALDDGVDLGAVLAVLVDDLTTYSSFFLGLHLTLPVPGGGPVTLSTLDPTAASAVRASMLLPLDRITAVRAGATVVFYASQPGVFAELADTARAEYGLDGDVVLDAHLEPAAAPAGLSGLVESGAVNQAIGVLIHHGHTPDEARELVVRRAAATGETLEQAALALIAAPPPV